MPPEEQPQNVLCIEDNVAIATLVKRILGRVAGISVVVANSGGEGLEVAFRLRPALIILDLGLPDIGGDEVLIRLRRDPQLGRIPVMVLTADATAVTQRKVEALGATMTMSKPIDIDSFLAAVTAVVSPSTGV